MRAVVISHGVSNLRQRYGLWSRSVDGWPWLLPSFALLTIVTLVPLGWLVWLSFVEPQTGFNNYIEVFTREGFRRALWRTLQMAAIVTIVTLVLGYPYAYAMTIAPRKTWLILTTIVLIPLWTSLMARTFAWVVLLADNGVVNNGLEWAGLGRLPLIRTTLGVTIGMSQILLPFMVLPIYNMMSGIDRRLLLAARTLGASNAAVFRTVFLPLTAPGVVAGATMVFIMSLGFYVTPALLGSARQGMIAQYIATQVNKLLAFGMAGASSVILLIVVAFLMLLALRVAKPKEIAGGMEAGGNRAANHRLPWPLRWFCALVATILLLPIPVVVLLAFADKPSFQFPPEGLSTRYFANLIENPVWLLSITNSLKYGVLATILASVLGSAAAYAIVRSRRRWRDLAYNSLLLPLVLPTIVGAIATYVFFLRLGLAGHWVGIVLAHAVLGLPFAVINVVAVLRSVDDRLELAASTLGASKLIAIWTVTLPLALPGVISGAAFAFVTSFDEVIYTLFLQNPDTRTLPVQMYLSVTAEVDPTIAAASTVVIVLTTSLFLATFLFTQRRINA